MPKACKFVGAQNPRDTLWDRPVLFSIFEDSKALSHALSTSAGPLRSYSEALYGRWVDLAGVRVLWPELMSTQLLDLLGRRFCAWLAFPSPSRLADPTSARFWLGSWPSVGRMKGSKGFTNASHGNLLQHGALWLHQPSQLRTAFVERHGWAEVTHCAYKGSYPKPLWLFSSGPLSPVEHRSAAVHAQAGRGVPWGPRRATVGPPQINR